MSGHTHIHTHIHTYTRDNYSNPRCACTPRVNNIIQRMSLGSCQAGSSGAKLTRGVTCNVHPGIYIDLASPVFFASKVIYLYTFTLKHG